MKKVTEVSVKGGGGGEISLSPPSSLSSSLRAPPALGTNFPFHPTLFNELMAEYFKINSSNLHINYPPSLWWFFHMFLLVSMKIDSEEKKERIATEAKKSRDNKSDRRLFSCEKYPQRLLKRFRPVSKSLLVINFLKQDWKLTLNCFEHCS